MSVINIIAWELDLGRWKHLRVEKRLILIWHGDTGHHWRHRISRCILVYWLIRCRKYVWSSLNGSQINLRVGSYLSTLVLLELSMVSNLNFLMSILFLRSYLRCIWHLSCWLNVLNHPADCFRRRGNWFRLISESFRDNLWGVIESKKMFFFRLGSTVSDAPKYD